MKYFSHTLTTKSRTIKRWHNPAHNFKRHSIPIRDSNHRNSINKVLYTPQYIVGKVEPINRFYKRSSYKGEGIIQGEKSRLRKSKKGKITKQSRAISACQFIFQFFVI